MAVRALTSAQRKLYARGLPVSCFGKLPLYEDFLRVPGSDGAAREFDGWMDRGFGLRWDDLGGGAETVARPTRMLYVAARTGAAVCAILADSHDRGGLRRFPFALYAELPVKAIDADSPAFISGLAPVWRALETLEAEARALPSANEFYQAFRGRRIAPEADDEEPADALHTPLAAIPGADSFPSGILHRLAEAVARQKEEARDRMALAYRLPLTPGASAELQAGAWARLLARGYSKHAGLPSLVLPRDADAGAAFAVLFRPLDPADVRLLSARADRAGRVIDLVRGGPDAPQEFQARVARDLPAGATLADLARFRLPKVRSAPPEEMP